MLGNSLKYFTTSSTVSDANKLWKYYQKKNTKLNSNTPGYLLLSPTDNSNVMNNIDFANISSSITTDSTAFKHIEKNSKLVQNINLTELSNNNLNFSKLNNLYLNDFESCNSSNSYGFDRAHNQTSTNSFLSSFLTLIDKVSFNKYFSYSTNLDLNSYKNHFKFANNYNFFNENRDFSFSKNNSMRVLLNSYIDIDLFKSYFSTFPFLHETVNNNADVSSLNNSLVYLLNSSFLKTTNSLPFQINTYLGELEKNNQKTFFS